ncbi:MAG: UDP-N-acetylglucosamine 1-carboxyvinyltransferase [Clostridia bacterium]|nr:UDP-N-acetylglucosamine 1-carboxyvinyltransferase [Clostridia bacterium]
MELRVAGGRRLAGHVGVGGSRNSALAVMAASLLAEGETTIDNVPDNGDVRLMGQILQGIGVGVRRSDPHVLQVRVRRLIHHEPDYELSKMIRASSLLIGPILARTGKARVAMPDGEQIGPRPMDLHLKGMRALGADVAVEHGYVAASVSRLSGARIYLDFPSVGATESIMMGACLAKGTSIIENAAKEPEVVDLANFLTLMGAAIRGAGTDAIRVDGVDSLSPVTYSVIPDRIEAATILSAGLITRGRVRVMDVIPTHLDSVLSKLAEMGAELDIGPDYVELAMAGPIRACDTKTGPYPGFPTDMQPQLSAVMSLAAGVSVLTESVFDNRFLQVDELRRMGALMRLESRSLIIEGIERLTGAMVRAVDPATGAALILAGLAAEGETSLSGVEQIDRCYEGICGKLNRLGACVSRFGATHASAVGEEK